MTTQLQATSVSTSVEVDAPAEHAFRVFTEGIGSCWEPSHHILEAELAEMVFEPHVGGQRSRGHLHPRRPRAHPRRTYPPPPRSSRRRLGGHAGRGPLRLEPRPLLRNRRYAVMIGKRPIPLPGAVTARAAAGR